MAAVVVVRRHLRRQIHDAQLQVRADLAPHPRVARVAPRIVQPRVVAVLVGARNRVEDPLANARRRVEAPHVALRVAHRPRRAPRHVRRAHHHRVARHQRRRVQADLPRQRVDVLIHVLHQVHDAVVAEIGQPRARLRVQPDQPVARRHVEDLPVAPVVAVRQAPARPPPRRVLRPLALVEPVHPQQLARRRVRRNRRPPQPGRRVHDAVDHQRRRLEVVLRRRAEVVRLQPPGHLQLVEVPGRDLVERRVARVRDVAAVAPPLAVVGLPGRRPGARRQQPAEHHDRRDTLCMC